MSVTPKEGATNIARLRTEALLVLAACLLAGFSAAAESRISTASEPARNFRQMLIYYGGAPALSEKTAHDIAAFDLLAIDRWRYRDLRPDSWTRLRELNPNILIFLYQLGPQSSTAHDGQDRFYLNNISRYQDPRGHPMGAVTSDPNDWILKNYLGSQIRPPDLPDFVQLDFGSPTLQQYWAKATELDILAQQWRADGIIIDNCSVDGGGIARSLAGRRPARYPTAAAWNTGMNSFVSAASTYLQARGQKVMSNRGGSRLPEGRAAWLALDATASAPDFVMEEGAFAVNWGPGDVQFYPSDHWLNQVTLARDLRNSSVVYVSHTDIAPGGKGVDSAGNPVSFGQIFLFAAGSYLLARDDQLNPTYFSFNSFRGKYGYSRVERFTALDLIETGPALGEMQALVAGQARLYERQFATARVIVNPSPLPGEVLVTGNMIRVQTPDGKSITLLPAGRQVHVDPHSAVILLSPRDELPVTAIR